MTFLEAAEKVLRQAHRPMRPDEIVSRAIVKGWILAKGKTPEATMGAQLAMHIKKGGKVFVRTSPGFYGLAGKNKRIEQRDLFDEAKKDAGYVYILTNPSFRRDWVKIGMTERPVNTRSKELDNTAVPLPFEIYATLKTNHRQKIERLLHGSIDDIAPNKRIRKTREFFNISPETALKLLVRAAEVFDEERYIDEVFKHKSVEVTTTDISKEPKQDELPKQGRKGAFKFSECGIKPGEKVYFIKDESKFAIVVDDRRVRFGDEVTFLTALAKKLLGIKRAIQGTAYFKYNGIPLTKLRK